MHLTSRDVTPGQLRRRGSAGDEGDETGGEEEERGEEDGAGEWGHVPRRRQRAAARDERGAGEGAVAGDGERRRRANIACEAQHGGEEGDWRVDSEVVSCVPAMDLRESSGRREAR